MKIKMAVLGVLAALGLATQAGAVQVTATFQGFVDAGSGSYDASDLFGGGYLDGDAITATFVYDTALGFESTDGDFVDELDGGSGFADGVSTMVYASPILSASFTIAGHTYSFSPDYYADVYTEAAASGYPPLVADTVQDTAGDEALVSSLTNLAPGRLSSSFYDFNATPTESYLDTAFEGPAQSFDAITFSTDSIAVSAAPEPSVWTLMIAGVGLAGFALRRRTALTLA